MTAHYMKMPTGSFNYAIIPNRRNQDFVKIGHHENYYWIVCCDGHGDDTFIDILRRLNWGFIMGHESSYECLMKILETSSHLYNVNSGSTLAMVKIHPTEINTITIGDTPVIIYKNEHMVYKSPLHNLDNPLEKERIQNDPTNYSIFYKYSAKIETFKKYRVSLLGYTTFHPEVSLSMTQSLGHEGLTLYKPETFQYKYDPDDNIRVIVGTDGFFDMWILQDDTIKNPAHAIDANLDHIDMVTRNSSYLSEKVQTRWTQQWEHHWNPDCEEEYQVNCFTSKDIDDISIVVWDNLK